MLMQHYITVTQIIYLLKGRQLSYPIYYTREEERSLDAPLRRLKGHLLTCSL